MTDFSGKVAIVTGAASGMGRAVAHQFANRGASVVIGDLSAAAGEEVVNEIIRNNGKAVFVRTDVTNPVDVDALVAAAMEHFGRLDYAANMAGVTQSGGLFCSDKERDLTLAVNLMGTILCTTAEVKAMRQSGGKGAIVNIASVTGAMGAAGSPYYVAAKHAVVGFSKSAALELAQEGIRVNIVSPGLTRTSMTKSYYSDLDSVGRVAVPLGRLAEPTDQANAILWLCSDEAAFVTGANFNIDGGQTAGLAAASAAAGED